MEELRVTIDMRLPTANRVTRMSVKLTNSIWMT